MPGGWSAADCGSSPSSPAAIGCRWPATPSPPSGESSARLEVAKACATLGDALAEAGSTGEAEAEWAAAAALAEACGAAGLARRAADAAAGRRAAATPRTGD